MQEQECATVQDQQCTTVQEQQCSVGSRQECNTVNEQVMYIGYFHSTDSLISSNVRTLLRPSATQSRSRSAL